MLKKPMMWDLLENVHSPVPKKIQRVAVAMTVVGISAHWKILQMIVLLACTTVNGYMIVKKAIIELSKILRVQVQNSYTIQKISNVI